MIISGMECRVKMCKVCIQVHVVSYTVHVLDVCHREMRERSERGKGVFPQIQ